MSDNLYLFANNNGGQAENNGSYRLYGMKIDGDSEGVESGVDYVNYLQSDGKSWIDTEISIITGYRVEVEIMKFKHVGSTYIPICGVGTPIYYSYGADHADFGIGLNYSRLALKDDSQEYAETQTEIPLNVRTTIKYTAKNVVSKHSLPLFTHGVTSSDKFYTDSNLADYAIIYSFRIFDENNRLIQDLRPCLDTKGTPCMYDEVNKKYLPNKGTGTFKYKKKLRDFQPVLDSNNIPCLLDKINKKYYYNKGTGVFNTKEKPKYKKLKYIQGDKASYINTGLIGKNIVGYDVEIGCLNIATDAKGYLFGIVDKNNNINTSNIGFYGDVGGNNLYMRGFESHTKTLDGEARVIKLTNLQQNSYTSSIFLFAGSEFHSASLNEPYFFSDVAILYFKVFDTEDNLVMHLIPVMDTNNKIGMYDLVSEQFFYNQGTGTFGYEIEELDAPQIDYVEYIQGDGRSWIDTGIVPNLSMSFYCDFTLDTFSTTVFGAGGLIAGYGVYQSANRVYYGGSENLSLKELKYGDRYINLLTPKGYEVTDITDGRSAKGNYSFTPSGETSRHVILFAESRKVDGVIQNIGTQKIYEFKILNGNVLIMHLKPCLDTEGIPCMYDEVSKKYFYNQGTGRFSYGKRIPHTEIDYIESTGTQYIDTGVVPNSNTDIDMTCRLSAMPYYFSGWKTQVIIGSLKESFVIELDLKYSESQTGTGSIVPNYLYVLSDGCYSLNGTDTTSVKASTNKYDKVKIIANIGEKKEYVYINNKLIGEKVISELSRISFGGSHENYSSCYTHYIDIYKLSDMNLLYSLRPVMNDYYWSDVDYTYKVPMLYDEINSRYYDSVYSDNRNYIYVNYGYDDNYIYNNLKTLNKYSIQNTENTVYSKTIYDKTVYEYNGVDTTVQPNLVASTGATLTMGDINLKKLNDDDIETATNNGWSLV